MTKLGSEARSPATPRRASGAKLPAGLGASSAFYTPRGQRGPGLSPLTVLCPPENGFAVNTQTLPLERKILPTFLPPINVPVVCGAPLGTSAKLTLASARVPPKLPRQEGLHCGGSSSRG